MEIYWTQKPEWLQPKILVNIIHIIPVSGDFFYWHILLNYVTRWGQQCSTVTTFQNSTTSHTTVSKKNTCIAIIHLFWEWSSLWTNKRLLFHTNYTDKIHFEINNAKVQHPGSVIWPSFPTARLTHNYVCEGVSGWQNSSEEANTPTVLFLQVKWDLQGVGHDKTGREKTRQEKISYSLKQVVSGLFFLQTKWMHLKKDLTHDCLYSLS